MKKNIVIIVLAVLVVMFGLNSLYQMVKANQFEAEVIENNRFLEAARAEAVEMMLKAESQTKIARAEKQRADSLQQLLDKCK